MTKRLRLGWMGFHQEGVPTLLSLIDRGESVVGAVTLTEQTRSNRSGAADIAGICRNYEIPTLEVDNANEPACVNFLRDLDLDLLIVLGWSQILHASVLGTARIGVLGAHASLLPHNRGSAPVNWALIRGESEGGNTLMWLSEGVDSGDVAAQRAFPLLATDTCATVYERVAQTNLEMVLETIQSVSQGLIPRRRQQPSNEPVLPRRRPQDGAVCWDQSAQAVYNFVRGITRPYPGASSTLRGDRVLIWRCSLLPPMSGSSSPGKVLGTVLSTESTGGGVVVDCSEGQVVLTEVESGGRLYVGVEVGDLVEVGDVLA